MGKVGVILCACELEGVHPFDGDVLLKELKVMGNVLPLVYDSPACSESRMDAIRAFLERNGLDRAVVACAKPELFAPTLKRALRDWGLDPSLSEVVDIGPAVESVARGDRQEAVSTLFKLI